MRVFKLIVVLFILLESQLVLSQETVELPEGIMATRGEGAVSRGIFDASLSSVPEKDRLAFLSSGRRVESRIADLLMTSQLVAAARGAGFDKSSIQYRMQLAAERELAEAWLKHYVDNQPPADYEALAREYYLLNKDKMLTTPTIDITHLLVSYDNLSKEEAMEQAQKYLDRALEDPTVFEELITNHSEDPSVSSNKGSYKGVKKGDMVKAFEEAAFALENPGQFSGLVPSQYGVHIIRLDAINPSQPLEFDIVKKQLMAQQEQEHRDRVRADYLNKLGTMPWTVSEEELESMIDRYTNKENAHMESKQQNSE